MIPLIGAIGSVLTGGLSSLPAAAGKLALKTVESKALQNTALGRLYNAYQGGKDLLGDVSQIAGPNAGVDSALNVARGQGPLPMPQIGDSFLRRRQGYGV